MIYYFLQTIIISAILTLSYFLLFRMGREFVLRRIFILLIPFASLSIPFIKIPYSFSFREVGNIDATQVLDSITVGLSKPTHQILTFDYIQLFTLFYFLVSFILLVQFLFQIRNIFGLKKESEFENGIYYLPHSHQAFSFFNLIFIPNEEKDDAKLILQHEKIHIQQKHSFDILYFKLLNIIFWLNPFYFLLNKEIANVHEFLVDKELLDNKIDIEAYCKKLLENNTLKYISITNNFNYSLTKIRFIMMTKDDKKQFVSLKLIAISVVVLSSTLLFAGLNSKIKGGVKTELTYTNKTDSIFNLSDTDVQPTYTGGMPKMIEMISFIEKNTKYPETSKEKGIQGTVYVGFVIDKKGKVGNVKIVTSVSEELDKEAIRVISSMPDWTPVENNGKKIKVKYIIPVNFKLFKDKDK